MTSYGMSELRERTGERGSGFMAEAGNSPFCFVLLIKGEPPSPAHIKGRGIKFHTLEEGVSKNLWAQFKPNTVCLPATTSSHFSHMRKTPIPSQGCFPKSTVSAFALFQDLASKPGPDLSALRWLLRYQVHFLLLRTWEPYGAVTCPSHTQQRWVDTGHGY